jgi:hypothetical protein
VQILIYPAGTEIPPNKQTQSGISRETTTTQSVQASTAVTSQPQ